MDWQPIETAPKDGTEIILFFPSYHQNKVGSYKWSPCWADSGADWQSIDGYAMASGEDAPTHWMPLPAPPEVKP